LTDQADRHFLLLFLDPVNAVLAEKSLTVRTFDLRVEEKPELREAVDTTVLIEF